MKRHKQTKERNWQEIVAHWLGRLLMFASIYSLLVNIIGWLMPPIQKVFSGVLFLFALPTEFSIFNAVFLFILASGIMHRRRMALWFEIIYFQFTFVALGVVFLTLYFMGMIESFDLSSAGFTDWSIFWILSGVIVCLITTIVLILSQKAFPTRIINGSWWKSIGVAISGFLLSLLGGMLISLITYHKSISLGQRFIYVWKEAISDFRYLLPFGSKFIIHYSSNNIWVSTTTTTIIVLGFVLAFLSITKANGKVLSKKPAQELAVRQLILDYGKDDSLAYFATHRSKTTSFSKNKKAVITYRLFGSVLLASGDPIGKQSAWKSAGYHFLELARQNGWTPAVVGASKIGASFYHQIGLKAVAFGDEAVVVVENFSTSNREMHDVSQVMRRAKREDYTVQIRKQNQISQDELKQLRELANNWRSGEERGYSMTTNRFGDPTDEQTVIVTALDKSGKVRGLLSFVPVGSDKLSLDVMRRDSKAMNGVITFMITSLIEAGKKMNVAEVSLNFAAARQFFVKGQELQANSIDKTMRRIMLFFSRWYQLESLYRSNDIYLPEWRQRYICYDKSGTLSSVLLAIGQAEGFVPIDPFSRIRNLFRRYHIAENKWWATPEFIEKTHQMEKEHMDKLTPQKTYDESRIKKLNHLRKIGIAPYCISTSRTHSIEKLRAEFFNRQEFDDSVFKIHGRLMDLRGHGAICFSDLQDNGHVLQIVLRRDIVDENAHKLNRLEDFSIWKSDIAIGDIVEVEGTLMKTKIGELSLKVKSWRMISKAITALSEEGKEHRFQTLQQVNAITKFRLKLLQEGMVEVSSNMVFGLSSGISKVFSIQDNRLKIAVSYESKEELVIELQKVLVQKLSIFLNSPSKKESLVMGDGKTIGWIQEVLPDATQKWPDNLQKIFEQGVPPFVRAEILLDSLL